MSISKIYIENVRGFDSVTLDVPLQPNYVNILVAPNGFGKSSISTAFNSAAGRKMTVSDADKHKHEAGNKAVLKIQADGQWLQADENVNEISARFSINVIKSNLEPKAKTSRLKGITIARPYIEIPDIDLWPIVAKTALSYDIGAARSSFGRNAKLLSNLANKCADPNLRAKLLDLLETVDKLTQKRSSDFLSEVVAFAKSAVGTKRAINDEAERTYHSRLVGLPHLKQVFDSVHDLVNDISWIEVVLICYQINQCCCSDRSNLKAWLQHGEYLARMAAAERFIASINGAWVLAALKETKGRVQIKLPEAASLSTGESHMAVLV